MADTAGRSFLENSDRPPIPPLPEADRSDMDYFLDQLQIVLPVLGVNAIRSRKVATPVKEDADTDPSHTADSPPPTTQDSPVFVLRRPKRNVALRAQQIDGEFIVFEGSQVVAEWDGKGTSETVKRQYASLCARHKKLFADGTIVVKDGYGLLTRDVPFASPSGAGAVFVGTSCNGRVEWRTEDLPHMQFGEWESRGVD